MCGRASQILGRSGAGLLIAIIAAGPSVGTVAGQSATAPQPPSTAPRAGSFGPPPVRSPEVNPDRTVTLRLRAPNASAVKVRGLTPEPLAMRRDESGVWVATTPALRPDLHAYSFDVDGLTVPDPSNPRTRPSYRRLGQSAVLVPGDMPWTPLPNVPRGTVSHHFFRSAIANDDRDFFVYTPPNYDAKRKEPYPVLVLQHGLGDEATAWTQVGAANVTLDTLINQGTAVPMIMVNPLGYGTSAGPADIDTEGMLPAYIRILLEEVLPQVEKHYNVSRQPTGRAIAGLSMGGGQAMLAGLNHLETFAWLGSFSGAFNNWVETRPVRSTATPGFGPGMPAGARRPELKLVESQLPVIFPTLDARSNARIKLLWITCGTSDVLIGVNRQFKAYLDARGVVATYEEFPDQGHVWPLWRENLAEFAQLLFK